MKQRGTMQLAFGILLAALLWALPLHAAEQTQTLNLVQGWNSVWLEVSPTYATGVEAGMAKRVEDVFDTNVVEVVASVMAPVGTAEFITSTTTDSFMKENWQVWRDHSQLGVDTLVRIRGNRPYLVKAAANVSLNVTGEVRFFTPDWAPSSYSLVGFSLSGAVTFGEFFQGAAGAHDMGRIRTLDTAGNWGGVSASDVMQSHTAYWIFSERKSDYAGPVSVLFDGIDSLSFGGGPGTVEVPDPGNQNDTILLTLDELTFTCIDTATRTVGLTKIDPPTTGGDAVSDELRLYEIVPVPTNLLHKIGGSGQVTSWAIGSVVGQTTKTVTIGAHRNWTTGDRDRENLYRIDIGIGAGTQHFWLPVRASNAELLGGTPVADNAGAAGLWIGSIRLNEVTSITEPGAPLQPTTSSAPLRMLLHVNAAGEVSLLSRVMVMQTKTADDSVSPETVLVVNEERIPFFEGIEERSGTRIGRRIETVAFDMPRKMDLLTQTNLIDDVAGALSIAPAAVTASNITVYVNSRDSRPPPLVEAYEFTWPLDGGLGGGGLLSTALDQPLLLDPFHRSNPFRHAFHTRHGAGFPIERHIKIRLDEQSDADLLTGLYEETLTGPGAAVDGGTGRLVSPSSGLTSFSIIMCGPISLERVSTVANLEE